MRTVCLSTDLEGVKLDAVIAESKLSKNIYTNHENINKNIKLIEKISHELAIMQCEQQDHFRKISKHDLAINQLIHHSEAIQSEQGKNNQQISEQYTSIEQISEGSAVMHDEHVLIHSSKNSPEIIQSKETKDVNVNSTCSHVIDVHDTASSAVETIPNQDKKHDEHRSIFNSDRSLIEIIELCEDVISIDPDNGLNKPQENCTLLKTPIEDQLSVTFTTTHCNETTETGCEINNITNLTNGKSIAPEVNPTMQNISPLPTMRITTDAKTTPKVPTASSYHMLKNTKKNSFPVDWLGKLPLIEGKHKLQSVKFLKDIGNQNFYCFI